MLADLFHAENSCGTATVGSSEVGVRLILLFWNAQKYVCFAGASYPWGWVRMGLQKENECTMPGNNSAHHWGKLGGTLTGFSCLIRLHW